MNPSDSSPQPIHRFAHNAMACVFEIVIAPPGGDGKYAEQAADAAFTEVDRLEQDLSRFIETSDIARINLAQPGQWVRIGPAALECMELARQVHEETNGAFDVTVGGLVDWQTRGGADPLSPGEKVAPLQAGTGEGLAPHSRRGSTALTAGRGGEEPCFPGMAALEISREYKAVGIKFAGAVVDLGALGKGYAVDQIAAILRDWSIKSALIHSGQSTAYALGPPADQAPWKLAIRDPLNEACTLGSVLLRDAAFSGSGIQLHGKHIIDPRTGRPADRNAAWALAPTAGVSDAVSTAFMVMSDEEVGGYCQRHGEISAILLGPVSTAPGSPGLTVLNPNPAIVVNDAFPS